MFDRHHVTIEYLISLWHKQGVYNVSITMIPSIIYTKLTLFLIALYYTKYLFICNLNLEPIYFNIINEYCWIIFFIGLFFNEKYVILYKFFFFSYNMFSVPRTWYWSTHTDIDCSNLLLLQNWDIKNSERLTLIMFLTLWLSASFSKWHVWC